MVHSVVHSVDGRCAIVKGNCMPVFKFGGDCMVDSPDSKPDDRLGRKDWSHYTSYCIY